MATADTIAENKRIARELVDAIWSEQFEDVRALCAEDCVFHDPASPEGFDVDGMVSRFEEVHAALSDVDYEIQDLVAEGDLVFFRGRLAGVHSGEFMGVAPTNERVSSEDHIEVRIEDGKIAESWAQYDVMGMMAQLGVEMPGLA